MNKLNELIIFFNEIGKLKKMPRRGWVINDIKNPESIAEHTFRAAIIAWILGIKKDKKLNIERILKIALIHDLCEIYAGDTTPYDSVLPKTKQKRLKFMKTWPRFKKSEKERLLKQKYKKEKKSLEKLVSELPQNIKTEIINLWLDYEKGLTKEGRFFKQADRLESFLQASEYWKKYKKPPKGPWWIWAREFFDDPILLECIEIMNEKFYKK